MDMSDKIRLLVCKDCHTVEPLPWYEGPVDYDVLLDYAIQAHRFPNGEEHRGLLMNVDRKWWDIPSAREQITKELGVTTGLGSETYATIETFKEDAAKCFTAHRRTIPCIDWQSDKKRIGNPTKTGWEAGPKVYLCDFCVVCSHVDTEKRHQAGLYHKENN